MNGQSVSVMPNVARLSKNGNYGSIANVRSGGYTANNYAEEENCSDDSDLSDDRSKKRGSVFKKLSDGPITDRAASLHEMAAQTQRSNTKLRNAQDELSRLLRKLSLGKSCEYRISKREHFKTRSSSKTDQHHCEINVYCLYQSTLGSSLHPLFHRVTFSVLWQHNLSRFYYVVLIRCVFTEE